MTLILKLGLGLVKIYHHTEIEISMSTAYRYTDDGTKTKRRGSKNAFRILQEEKI